MRESISRAGFECSARDAVLWTTLPSKVGRSGLVASLVALGVAPVGMVARIGMLLVVLLSVTRPDRVDPTGSCLRLPLRLILVYLLSAPRVEVSSWFPKKPFDHCNVSLLLEKLLCMKARDTCAALVA